MKRAFEYTRRCVVALALALAFIALAACATNPATGRQQFQAMSVEDEIRLGQQATPEFVNEYGGEIPSERVRNYVADLGMKLAAQSEAPNLPWEFHALDSSVINAFAIPGGKVFVTRGLMEKLQNEAMLAGVLGHEIGHVTARHINDQMVQRIGVSAALIGLGVAAQFSDEDWLKILGVGAGVGGTVYLLSYGRDQEKEADTLGLRYMTRVGYNPVGQIQVMEVLRDASGAGGGTPEFLSTHPLPQTRIRNLESYIRKEYPRYDEPGHYRFNQDQYKANILDELAKLPPAKHNPQAQQ